MDVIAMLPRRISGVLEVCEFDSPVEEIRLRVARPPQIVTAKNEKIINGVTFSKSEARELLERLCRHSVYACEDELRRGFVTLEGGARVGVCGRPVTENGNIIKLTDITCFNIRITREAVACAEGIMGSLLENGRIVSTLIAAPPGGGKTTLLRDITRCISNGIGVPSAKVALVDERGEIAGCVDGIPSFDIGSRTDIMELAPKSKAISMFVRTMSPDVIITDEVGGAEDAEAIAEAARCGTSIIASAHASTYDELLKRESLAGIVNTGVFRRILLLKRSGSKLKITPIRI